MPVRERDGLILLTSANKVVRIGVDEVGSKGRATMGVMLVRLDEGARVVGFDRVDDGGQSPAGMEEAEEVTAAVAAEEAALADDTAGRGDDED